MDHNTHNQRKTLLLVFGEGGHATAMHRLINRLDVRNIDAVQIREYGAKAFSTFPDYPTYRVMPKRNGIWRNLISPFRMLMNAIVVAKVFSKYRVSFILTTGPIIALLPCLVGRLLGIQCVFIESWARFDSISRTGKILKLLGIMIYYQNKELASLLPKATFCGRL
jgi:UDP-N-acetylglucosamine:LPS N-acetylglucosamine transferase